MKKFLGLNKLRPPVFKLRTSLSEQVNNMKYIRKMSQWTRNSKNFPVNKYEVSREKITVYVTAMSEKPTFNKMPGKCLDNV